MRYNETMLKKAVVSMALILVFLISSRCLLLGKMFFLHDFTHAARISEMARGLQDGDFPVQWSKNFGYGYGMPLFLFYGPLAYYVGAILYVISGSIVWSILLLLLLANVITLVGSYQLGKELSGKLSGILLATLYTLAPYRAVNLFLRGALNELWAMAFIPWLLLGWLLLIKKQKYAWLLIAVSSACILLSHNLSAMYFFFFLVVIGICFQYLLGSSKAIFSKNTVTTLGTGIASSILGFGLSAFYGIPVFAEKAFTRLDQQVLTGYFDYHNHFLYIRQFFMDKWTYGGSEWGPNDGISFFLGFGIIIGLSFAAFWVLTQKRLKQSKQIRLVIVFLFLLLVITMLFTTQKSLWFWEHFSFLPYLQFPWRLLSLIALLASVIIALWVSHAPHRKLLGCLLVAVTMITSFRYFVPAYYYDSSIGPYYTDPSRIQTEMSGILPDYLPKSFNSKLESYQTLIDSSDLVKTNILKDSVSEKLISVDSKEIELITVSIANFPGWNAYLNGQPIDISTSADGLIQLQIPKGQHELAVIFQATPVRLMANTISILSLILVCTVLYHQNAKKDHRVSK